MKRVACLLTIFCVSFTSAQDITFSFDNAQITNDGTNDYYEVDVMVSSSTDLLLGTGQFYINYNTTAFGTFVIGSSTGVFENTGTILGTGFWNPLISTDNTESRISYAYVQAAPSGAYGTDQTVTTTPKVFTHLKLQYLPGQTGANPSICFESGASFTDLNFTACGGIFGADCFSFPGMQITNDTFDCSGATLASCLTSTTYTTTGGWDNGTPTSTMAAIIADDYNTTSGNIEACSLTVNTGVTLTIQANQYIEIQNNITVNGSLIVEHQGSVVQIDDAATVTNNGTINVGLTTPNLASRDFMVIGSPMSGETRSDVWGTAFLVLNHTTENFVPNPDVEAQFPLAENFADDNNDFWNPYTGNITPGEGYIVRPQSGYGQPGGVFNYTYDSGTLNTGNVNFSVIFNTNKNSSPNVLANPYPSAIDADLFINANAMIDEVYFWEHLTPPDPGLPGAGAMNFSMEDISMYNLMGGVAATADPTGVDTQPNGVISTAQGFGIKATAAGTAVFNNAMRLTTGNTTLRQQLDKERMWIEIASQEFALQNTTLIGFSDASTEGLDPGFDSRRLATILSIFSHLDDGSQELGIQSRETFDESIKIPLGFSTLVEQETVYEISISNIDGENLLLSDIFLYDSVTGIETNLSDGEIYSFTSGKTTQSNRFVIYFDRTILSTDDFDEAVLVVYPNPTTGLINISSKQAAIHQVQLFDMQGRMVAELEENGVTHLEVDLDHLEPAVYWLRVNTDRASFMKKVIKE